MSLIKKIEVAMKKGFEVKIYTNDSYFRGKICNKTSHSLIIKTTLRSEEIEFSNISNIHLIEPTRFSEHIQDKINCTDYYTTIDNINNDIRCEIQQIGAKSIKRNVVVEKYDLIKNTGNLYFYELYVSEEFKALEEANIELRSKNEVIEAVIISAIHDLKLTVQTNKLLTDEIYRIKVTFDPTFILKALLQSFDCVNVNNEKIFGKLINKNLSSAYSYESPSKYIFRSNLNSSQSKAVKLAINSEISFIWGPPGTGKTYTLAEILYQKIRENKKCLVVSTSNVAIDQLIVKFHQLIKDEHISGILRLGHTDNEITIGYLNKNAFFSEQKVIFSTLAMCAIKYKSLSSWGFDTVIVDEASMVSLPYALMVSNLALNSIVFAGDEKQLPPISVSGSPNLLLNIYEYIPNYKTSNLMMLLDVQYRMNEYISDFISDTFYEGKLKCGVGEGGEKPCFINIDNARYNNSYYSISEDSYYNPIGMFLVDAIIKNHFIGSPGTLIITPFRAQQMIYSKYTLDNIALKANSLTIHTAQGSEAANVIVDLTAYDRNIKFFNSTYISNLINVALSRPKKRLFLIGSLDMIKELGDINEFWRKLLDQINQKFIIYDYKYFLPNLKSFQFDIFGKNDCKSFLVIDDALNNDFTEYLIKEASNKKYYIADNDIIDERLINNQVVLRNKVASITLPFLVIYNEIVIINLDGKYKFLDLPSASGSLKRIAISRFIDIDDDSAKHTHSLLCERCNSNMIIETYYSICILRCLDCNNTLKITEKIANDMKRIYNIKCPICKSDVKPQRKKGETSLTFFGCMNYPRCDGIVSFKSLRG